MSRKDSASSSKNINLDYPLRVPFSRIPIPMKCKLKSPRTLGKNRISNRADKSHKPTGAKIGCDQTKLTAGNIAEPHKLPSPESTQLPTTTGSKGDHVPGPHSSIEGNSGDITNGKMHHSLDFLMEPRLLKEDMSIHQVHPKNFIGDHDHNVPTTPALDAPDSKSRDYHTRVTSKEKIALNKQKFNLQSPYHCEVFPQVLLLIPDMGRPGGYIAVFNIVNNNESLLAYKICMNTAAHLNYIIRPMYGVLKPLERIQIKITTKGVDGDLAGGFCQKFAEKDKLVIKTIESIPLPNDSSIRKFWNIAELKIPKLIQTTEIKSIKVLEPRNMAMLQVLDEGYERTVVQNALEDKYNKVLFPQMLANREFHSAENELLKLENRTNYYFWIFRKFSNYSSFWIRCILCAVMYLLTAKGYISSPMDTVNLPRQYNIKQFRPNEILQVVNTINKAIIGFMEYCFKK